MSTAQLSTSSKRVEYATADDIQKHFVAAMNDLFCLAFLLIANADGAEDCIIRSIRECFRYRCILKERLPAWVRDTVVRNGIKIVKDIEGSSFGETPRDSILFARTIATLYWHNRLLGRHSGTEQFRSARLCDLHPRTLHEQAVRSATRHIRRGSRGRPEIGR